jgi:hypothetical protein
MFIATKKKPKIFVNIAFFIDHNFINRSLILKKVVNNYLKSFSKVDICIHTNHRLKKKFRIKKVKYICHSLKEYDRWKLPWKSREYISSKKEEYDYYIYTEDDIFFTKKNFNYWIKYKDECIKNQFNLGFVRVEKNLKLFSVDINKKLSKKILINTNQFIINNVNPYCAFWIYDKNELNKFTKSKYWNLNNWSNNKYYGPREMVAIGWHGLNMDRYKNTILPIKNNKIVKEAKIIHLTNNYSNFNDPLNMNHGSLEFNNLF